MIWVVAQTLQSAWPARPGSVLWGSPLDIYVRGEGPVPEGTLLGCGRSALFLREAHEVCDVEGSTGSSLRGHLRAATATLGFRASLCPSLQWEGAQTSLG